MKTAGLILQKLSSRSSSIIAGCTAVGLLGGAVAAMILFSREQPIFESYSKIVLNRPPGAAGISDHDWLEKEAALLRSHEHLTLAAKRAGMDKTRGISADDCAEILEDAITAEVREGGKLPLTISDRLAANEVALPSWEYLSISMNGPSAVECATVVNALVKDRSLQLAQISKQLLEAETGYQSWLAMSREVAAIEKDIAQQRADLRKR
jgi:hypothetical protein